MSFTCISMKKKKMKEINTATIEIRETYVKRYRIETNYFMYKYFHVYVSFPSHSGQFKEKK